MRIAVMKQCYDFNAVVLPATMRCLLQAMLFTKKLLHFQVKG